MVLCFYSLRKLVYAISVVILNCALCTAYFLEVSDTKIFIFVAEIDALWCSLALDGFSIVSNRIADKRFRRPSVWVPAIFVRILCAERSFLQIQFGTFAVRTLRQHCDWRCLASLICRIVEWHYFRFILTLIISTILVSLV